MKLKTIIVLIALALAFTASFQNAQAQKKVMNYTKAISANPVFLAFGKVSATYEQQIAPANSFTALFIYNSYSSWTGIEFGGSYKWYIMPDQEKPIKGLSAGPLAALGMWSYKTEVYDNSMSLAIGGEIAYKWVFDGGFMVEPIAQIVFNILDVEGLTYRPVAVGVNLGYAW